MSRQGIRKALVIVAAVVVAGGALALGGSMPWNDKPYEQWNEKDVALILQNSPWAKVVPNVGGTLSQHGNTDLGGGEPVIGPGMGTGQVLPGEHDTPINDPRAPKTYWVVWWSARTVREAAARHAMLTGMATEEQMKQQASNGTGDYEVMIRGLNMSVFDERAEQSFMDKAFLQLKSSKEKIMPTRVEYLKTHEGHVSAAIFHFAMKNTSGEPIFSSVDKHVDFYCHVADGTIRTWFEPDKMVDNQGVDM
jgi:hypothetical protein